MLEEPISFDLKQAQFLRHSFYREVISSLEFSGDRVATHVRFVGGAVRNALLGLPSKDVDLATNLEPEEVVTRLEARGFRVLPTGLSHGTVRVLGKKLSARGVESQGDEAFSCEVTTLRRDITTDGRHAQVAFTDDWRVDASRRDFTINALYVDSAGNGYDYVGGVADLKARRLRFIGLPSERIAEDYLRILRLFRFRAQYPDLVPDHRDLVACAEGCAGISRLSGERIASELFALLGSLDPSGALRLMSRYNILTIDGLVIEDYNLNLLERMISFEREISAEDVVRRFFLLIDTSDLRATRQIIKDIIKRLALPTAIGRRLLFMCDYYALVSNANAFNP